MIVFVNETPQAPTLEHRWEMFDAAYVAYRAGDGSAAGVMAAIEALVDCYWQDGVVDVLEERTAALPGLGPVIASCWWSPAVPEELVERMERLGCEPRGPSRRLRQERWVQVPTRGGTGTRRSPKP
jgi:hypothetical protein